MKVKAIKKGYYGSKVRKVGEVFDYKEKDKNLPSWVTLADGTETNKGGRGSKGSKEPVIQKDTDKNQSVNTQENGIKKGDEVNQDNNADNKGNENNPENQNGQTETKEGQGEADNTKGLTETDKQQYLDLLINEGIEKNILIENADKKTIDEQIAELEKALNK